MGWGEGGLGLGVVIVGGAGGGGGEEGGKSGVEV